MSFRVVRQSKFRHVFGSNLKREQCYDNIRVSKASWDSTFCSVNPKFLAIIVESGGGGAFLVLPHSKTGRIAPDHPLVAGHKGPVLDIAFCPHNDNVIASGSEDCYVKVWQIPDGGLTRTMTECVVDLVHHQRRVGLVLWHPSAQNILLSAGSDNKVCIWNVGTGECLLSFTLPELVLSGCWNWDGSEVLFTCKDKSIRRVDPRTGEVEEEAIAHEGSKGARAIYLKNGLVFTTGFTKHSERQYSLRAPGHLDDPIVMVELDTSNGVMFPIYDPDTNLVYLCGKGDSVIRYFEITPEPPFVHYINTFQTPDPQRGVGFMPKRGCDVSVCEISRFYRLNNNGFCQVIPFKVPRKSELFQEDLYPDTQAEMPALTAEEWWVQRKNADPVLTPMSENGVKSTETEELVVNKKATPNVLNSRPVGGASSAAAAPAAEVDIKKITMTVMDECSRLIQDATGKQKDKIDELNAEIRKLKAMIVKHETRIRTLETKTKDQEKQLVSQTEDLEESFLLSDTDVPFFEEEENEIKAKPKVKKSEIKPSQMDEATKTAFVLSFFTKSQFKMPDKKPAKLDETGKASIVNSIQLKSQLKTDNDMKEAVSKAEKVEEQQYCHKSKKPESKPKRKDEEKTDSKEKNSESKALIKEESCTGSKKSEMKSERKHRDKTDSKGKKSESNHIKKENEACTKSKKLESKSERKDKDKENMCNIQVNGISESKKPESKSSKRKEDETHHKMKKSESKSLKKEGKEDKNLLPGYGMSKIFLSNNSESKSEDEGHHKLKKSRSKSERRERGEGILLNNNGHGDDLDPDEV